MENKKFNVTYPFVGWVTLQVTAESSEEAKYEFLEKANGIKLKGAVLEEHEAEYAWEFMENVNTGNVFHGEVAAISVEEVKSTPVIVVKCPECLSKTSNEELKMFGGMCEQCNEDLPF